jgi:hypothetical protein
VKDDFSSGEQLMRTALTRVILSMVFATLLIAVIAPVSSGQEREVNRDATPPAGIEPLAVDLFTSENFYLDRESWKVSVPGRSVAGLLRGLAERGLIECQNVVDGSGGPAPIDSRRIDWSVYDGYHCLLWEEHNDRYGSGPNVFRVTAAGRSEVEKSKYRAYDERLG